MATPAKRTRRERKNKQSLIGSMEEDFKDIEENFATDFTKSPKEIAKAPNHNVSPDKIGETSSADLQAIQIEYEKKLKAMEEEISHLKTTSAPLTANEKKLLSAIRSETILQETEQPIIGRSRLKKEYKINERYLGDAVEGLIQKNVIKRKYVNYSGKVKTSQWEIL